MFAHLNAKQFQPTLAQRSNLSETIWQAVHIFLKCLTLLFEQTASEVQSAFLPSFLGALSARFHYAKSVCNQIVQLRWFETRAKSRVLPLFVSGPTSREMYLPRMKCKWNIRVHLRLFEELCMHSASICVSSTSSTTNGFTQLSRANFWVAIFPLSFNPKWEECPMSWCNRSDRV